MSLETLHELGNNERVTLTRSSRGHELIYCATFRTHAGVVIYDKLQSTSSRPFYKKLGNYFGPRKAQASQFWCLIVFEGNLCQLTSLVVQISQTLGWNQYAVD